MQSAQSLIAEIEDHVRRGSDARRVTTLRRITDLFLQDADAFVDDQVALFDDVIGRLVDNIEAKALARLSRELAPIDNAPINVIRRLSRHDEIGIALPVLERSSRLSDQDLTEIASTKSQAHLLAIAGRRTISSAVTDILVHRGNNAVAQRTAINRGASFSNNGYLRLVERAGQDEDIADCVAARSDLPQELFERLVARASDAVLSRLLNHTDPATRKRMREIMPIASGEVEKLVAQAVDAAKQAIEDLATRTKLSPELVAHIVRQRNQDAVLILCKAAQMNWPLTQALLVNVGLAAGADDSGFREGRMNFLQLSVDTAQRVVRFMKARGALTDPDLDRMVREHAGITRSVDRSAARPN